MKIEDNEELSQKLNNLRELVESSRKRRESILSVISDPALRESYKRLLSNE